jgi:XTP/dITP diphosphohydrolase
MAKKIIIATHNRDKLREYEELLKPLGYSPEGPSKGWPEPEENGSSYAENAFIKARSLSLFMHSPVIADDSGLEIRALGNEPGLHSARYAQSLGGDYRTVNAEILRRMENQKDRYAAYRCAICYLKGPNAEPHIFGGICEGSILFEAKGHGGFGYDPIFHYDAGHLDFGLCAEEEKNAVSHRAAALRKLLAYLKNED